MNANRLPGFAGAIVVLGLTLAFPVQTASAAIYTWSPANTNWSAASNWGGTVPGTADIGLFNLNGIYAYQPNLAAAATVGGLWDTGSGSLAIGGSALTLKGVMINGNSTTGIEMDPGAGALSINSPVTLGASQQWLE